MGVNRRQFYPKEPCSLEERWTVNKQLHMGICEEAQDMVGELAGRRGPARGGSGDRGGFPRKQPFP